MLTKILPGALPAPVSARVVADAIPLPDLGSGLPAGDAGTTDRGTSGDAAPVQSDHETWMRDRLILAERHGEVVKLTGSRSISSPGVA